MVASTLSPVEQIVKLSKVPARTGFSRRTVAKWVNDGLECWYLGDTPVTTAEALSRFAVSIEPKTDSPRAARTRSNNADADIAALLAMK